MLTTLAVVCALALFAASLPARAAPPPIKVYLFVGQSNLGWSILSNDFKAYDGGVAGIWITSAVNDVLYYWWRGNVPNPSSNIAWQTLQPVTQRYSLEHIFAYEAWKYWKQQDPSNRIAILKVQFYGTSLFSYWNAGGRDRTPWSTNQPPYFSEGDGHRILWGRIRSGLATLSNAHELAGFFWYQGESDIDMTNATTAYATLFADLVNWWTPRDLIAGSNDNAAAYAGGLRGFTGATNMPVFPIRISWAYDALIPEARAVWEPALVTVRTALMQFAHNDPYATSKWIDIDDIAMRDYAHYASTNYIKIAARYVAAYFAALTNGNLPPATPTPLTPINGAELTAPPAVLAVYPFADPDQPDTQSAAQWQLGTVSNFTSMLWECLCTSNAFTIVALPDGLVSNDTLYFWRARHADNYGVWSPWSPVSTFSIVPEPSVCVLLAVLLALAWTLLR
jgi:hypothetical protein